MPSGAKKGKGICLYSQYTQDNLKSALDAVKDEGMSQRKASQTFGVPRSTIYNYISGRSELDKPHGRPQSIPADVERGIIDQAIKAADAALPLSRGMLLHKIGQVAHRLKVKTQFRNSRPGLGYWRRLKSRFPDLTIRNPEGMQENRMKAINKETIHKYFSHLECILNTHSLDSKPHKIWNLDETNFQLCHKPAKGITRRGSRNITARVSNSRQSISVLACINAAGTSLPPMCIVKGKTPQSLESYSVGDAPEGTTWSYQDKAWITELLGEEWFVKVFLKYCGEERPQIILCDSHASHESLSLLQKAKEENILILAFPPHTTSLLQPLDRVVFKPLKTNYSTIVSNYMTKNPVNTVDKISWPGLFKEAWEKTMTRKLIIKSFLKCGIHPVDPSVVSQREFMPGEALNGDVTHIVDNLSSPSHDMLLTEFHTSYEHFNPPRDILDDIESDSLMDTSTFNPNETIAIETTEYGLIYATPVCEYSNASDILNHNMDTGDIDLQPKLSQAIEDEQDPEGRIAHVINSTNIHVSEEDDESSAGSNSFAWNVHPFIETNRNLPVPSEMNEPNVPEQRVTILSQNDSSLQPQSKLWNIEVENIFAVPRGFPKKKGSRSLNSHRLLTSDEIILGKMLKKEKKEKDIQQKEERQRVRLQKRLIAQARQNKVKTTKQ